MNEKIKFVVSIILGMAVLFFAYSLLKKIENVKSWPTTTGKVLSSLIDDNVGGGHGTRMYGAKVKYQYSVAGITYLSEKISFGEVSTSNRNQAQKVVNKYAPDKEIVVYYNPAIPDEAILEPDETIYVLIIFILGALFVFVGIKGVIS